MRRTMTNVADNRSLTSILLETEIVGDSKEWNWGKFEEIAAKVVFSRYCREPHSGSAPNEVQ